MADAAELSELPGGGIIIIVVIMHHRRRTRGIKGGWLVGCAQEVVGKELAAHGTSGGLNELR